MSSSLTPPSALRMSHRARKYSLSLATALWRARWSVPPSIRPNLTSGELRSSLGSSRSSAVGFLPWDLDVEEDLWRPASSRYALARAADDLRLGCCCHVLAGLGPCMRRCRLVIFFSARVVMF